ncbi:Rox3-domain-containing protein [Xylariaceae sp. FL0255]|nr:Rox3-domain-containing protein [Xylariaceae sp. FL0255]
MSFNPQTPQSPSQFSPSVADQGTGINNTSMATTTTSLPTPAHSVNGSILQSDGFHDTAMTDVSSNKRKNSFGDAGAREHKKVHLEDPRKIGIQDLHLDVGEKLLLCRTPHTFSSPRVSEDLFHKYNLTGIAADVARIKPDGSKNALRKTYKGQIKTLGLSGHFDVVKKDPSPFMELLMIADEDWQNRVVSGKEIERGLSQTHQANLSKATTMARGKIPKGVWDVSVLGDMAPVRKGLDHLSRPTAPGTPIGTAKGSKPLAPQIERAQRTNAKRSYHESSFEGYSEGGDDTGAESTADDRSSKRRRQVHPS